LTKALEVAGADAFFPPAHVAGLHNALGLTVIVNSRSSGPLTDSVVQEVAGHFRRAVECDPQNIVAALNLIEALTTLNQTTLARQGAQRLLQALDRGQGGTWETLDAGHLPTGFDLFRVEWEKAAWSNAGDPAAEVKAKHRLLRWRLHTIIADLSGDL